eukprot:CCRYP_008609-RA/>CCRYP_008609-RA protein AED:0.10 eAED:0.10 QI:84/0.5/0.66/1/1/1/3/220/158
MSLANIARTCQRSFTRRIVPVTTQSAPKRCMGGGGGHQPISRSMEAELFGGHPKAEGWETTTYITYATSVVLFLMATVFAPDTSIKTWASSEARARLRLQAEGKLEQPVFGVHYDTHDNNFDFESVSPDNPFNEEDDEDEDDADDEEEEEEEEEEDDE